MPFYCSTCFKNLTRTTPEKHEKTKIHIKNQERNLSKNDLLLFLDKHKDYVSFLIQSKIKIRLPNFPEHISESIVKFVIHYSGDMSVSKMMSGDLVSITSGKQECKSFMSNGPISFSPTGEWNVIYFLDAREWINDRYIVYKVNLSNHSEYWKNIKVNHTQTFEAQCVEKRRPRITWKSLYPQIEEFCEKIFDNSIKILL
jgi:hypothetical protein